MDLRPESWRELLESEERGVYMRQREEIQELLRLGPIAALSPTDVWRHRDRPNSARATPSRTLIATLLLSLAGWASNAGAEERTLPCPPADKACAWAALKKHPVKRAEFWKAAMGRPLGERIGAAPPELVELIALDNIAHEYPNKPRVPKLERAFVAEVRRAFEEIPEAVKRRLAGKLAGIYFVDDIGSTGFSDSVLDSSGKPVLGFIVLDPTVLVARTANAWATWKDNTPFRPDPAWKLSERIEDGARDDRTHAIQYILLHELAHVLSIGAGVQPPWVLSPKEVKSTREYPFFELSWSVKGDEYVTPFDVGFPERKQVRFYFGAKLDGNAMKATYDALERTSFPTLYAATHPADDFAESLANYVHVVMMKKPFEIRISKNGGVVKAYTACWTQARCAAKRRYLEEFLGTR